MSGDGISTSEVGIDSHSQELKDIGDSLRLEVAGTPREQAWIRDIADTYTKSIESHFGQFIPDESKKRGRIAGYNTLQVDNLVHVRDPWEENPESHYSILDRLDGSDVIMRFLDQVNVLGSHLEDGGVPLNFVKSFGKIWIGKEKEKQMVVSKIARTNGISDKEAEGFLKVISMHNIVAHELAHAYIDSSLPHNIDEFLAEAIGNELSEETFKTKHKSSAYKYFDELAKKYGNDFYRYVFGGLRNPVTRFRISHDLNKSSLVEPK